jgi:3-oxoacyl-[acyl-carrier protein] reductase
MGRIPPPGAVAGTALFLATEEASHITGAYMLADGGFNMVGA